MTTATALPRSPSSLLRRLVCLAVWLAIGARSTGDKVLAVIFPVSAFVAAGFEHSVANMYLVPPDHLFKAWAPGSLWTELHFKREISLHPLGLVSFGIYFPSRSGT